MQRIWVDPNRNTERERSFSQHIRLQKPYKVDFFQDAADQGATVSSVTWTSVGTREVTIETETLSSGVAQAYLSSQWSGWGNVRVEATFSNSKKDTIYIKLHFVNPEYR